MVESEEIQVEIKSDECLKIDVQITELNSRTPFVSSDSKHRGDRSELRSQRQTMLHNEKSRLFWAHNDVTLRLFAIARTIQQSASCMQ
jgi:hypothetical protein